MEVTKYYCDKCGEEVKSEDKLLQVHVYSIANDTQIISSYAPMRLCKKCYNKYASICQIFRYL